ncbi:MAG TPA: hypothetical protein V6D08_10660 [Candidatus Obscuribacterales bacterium]
MKISYHSLSKGITRCALLASCAAPVLIQQPAVAADPGLGQPNLLASYERRFPGQEQVVLTTLASLQDSGQNTKRASELLTTLAVLCAQQGKNTEAEFYYQAAIECLKGAAR